MFKHMAKIDIFHVAYRGGAPAVAAAASGEVQVTFANYSDALTWMKTGGLRAVVDGQLSFLPWHLRNALAPYACSCGLWRLGS
jgi:hypothetical protein